MVDDGAAARLAVAAGASAVAFSGATSCDTSRTSTLLKTSLSAAKFGTRAGRFALDDDVLTLLGEQRVDVHLVPGADVAGTGGREADRYCDALPSLRYGDGSALDRALAEEGRADLLVFPDLCRRRPIVELLETREGVTGAGDRGHLAYRDGGLNLGAADASGDHSHGDQDRHGARRSA